jgi:hypothetical protein
MSNQVSAADLLRCLYRVIHDEFPPIEENYLHWGETLQLPPVFKDICPVIFVASAFKNSLRGETLQLRKLYKVICEI